MKWSSRCGSIAGRWTDCAEEGVAVVESVEGKGLRRASGA